MEIDTWSRRKAIGGRLRSLRESKRPIKKMSVVSELCGLGTSSLRRYERGECIPCAAAVIALAEYYEVTTDYILCVGHDANLQEKISRIVQK